MKYSFEDLERIARYEEKRGIKYAKSNGKLCKWFIFFGFISFIWMLLNSIAYILGRYIKIGSGVDKVDDILISILVVSAVALLSFILYFLRFKIAFLITNITAAIVTFILFAGITGVDDSVTSAGSTISEYDQGYFGLKRFFYWRHGIPAVLLVLLFAVIIFVKIRERRIMKKEYNLITKNNYEPQFNFARKSHDILKVNSSVKALKCPSCGADIKPESQKCEFCGCYLVIDTKNE